MKNATIYCVPQGESEMLKFYLKRGTDIFYLFNQRYHQSIETLYQNGVSINDLCKRKKNRDPHISKVATKLPLYIRYIEKEYDTAILNKTAQRMALV